LPVWLDLWPTREQVQSLFSLGIRNYASRVLRERVTEFTWNETGLTLSIGAQQASWQLVNGCWTCRCTCGYREGRCAHSYAAALLFQEVLKNDPQHSRSSSSQSPGSGTANARIARSPGPASDRPPSRSGLRTGSPTRSAGIPRPLNVSEKKLEVELDFHHSTTEVTIRFYLFDNGQRNLLRMQQLFNLCLRLQRNPDLPGWRPEDRRMLAWVTPQLRRHPCLIKNLQVLKIRKAAFEHWLEHWRNEPGRFIERDSQRTLNAQKQAATLHFELTLQGDKVEIAAIITTASGQRHHFHDIFDLLATGKKEILLKGELLEFEPPISMKLLCEIFAKKSPHMPTEHVCGYLPDLLEQRLDIVQGPAVRHKSNEGKLLLEARADGGDILLKASIKGCPLLPQGKVAAGNIHLKHGHFVITSYTAPGQTAWRTLFAPLPLQREKNNFCRLAGTAANMQLLTQAWDKLPPEIETRVAPELACLLCAPVKPVPKLHLHEHGNFLDLDITWQAENRPLPQRDIQSLASRGESVFRSTLGTWIRLDADALQEARDRIASLQVESTKRCLRHDVSRVLDQASQFCDLAEESRPLVERIRHATPPEPLRLPEHLDPILRHYQKTGFEFLGSRYTYGVGSILADDMGLGKTLQVLSVLEASRANGDLRTRGVLVICPASVVSVWLAEAKKFSPGLRCCAYRGTPDTRQGLLTDDWDILVANYSIVRNDIQHLQALEFAAVVLDEAQQIKNPEAQITRAVKLLRTPRRLCLTGTPLENKVLDLWSIMDFLNPGYLGTQEEFLASLGTEEQRSQLSARLAPVMLRRTKKLVAPELPPKIEEVLQIELNEAQREHYQNELARARVAVQDRGPVEILAALTRLRQICCHPELALKQKTSLESAKLETLLEMLQEVLSEGHSALVFSQFASMLKIIEDSLRELGLPSLKITGSTPAHQRSQLVDEFTESDTPQVFLLSLKAAGTGLTLTKADYVFMYDPWWNPAAERQAIDRTHRIGQDKSVIAYRMVCTDTVEEKVLALQQQKAELFDNVMDAAGEISLQSKLSAQDLANLLQ
jgi:superfamily II DNA or RNA helicase